MKKVILFLLLLLTGCSSFNQNVETVIENTNNVLIAINYPETGIKSLDKEVKEYVNKIYIGFKDEYENVYSLSKLSELNIDYRYEIINDRYINIILYTFINSSKLAHPINEVATFVFDKNINKVLTLEDIIDEEQLTKLVPTLKNGILKKYKECALIDMFESNIIANYSNFNDFSFDNENLTFYFNPYYVTSGNCNIINIDVPIKNLNLKIDLKEKHETINKIVEANGNKVLYPNKKSVAITFDDGPSKYTDKILDLLKQYDSNATFFVLGNKVNMYSDTIIESIKMGNEIGNHTYNHKWLTKLTIEELKEQVLRTNEKLSQLGYDCKLFRPAYGSLNKKIRENIDMNIIMWTVDSSDWKIKNSKKIADRVLKEVDDMDIILFHDTYERTYNALKIVIPKLIEEGYQLVTVSELEEIKLLRNVP